jgi:hypothetical protein
VRLADQWALLGLAPTDDKREVKRAYARTLKTIDVDADPQAFIALREAMEAASAWGTRTPWWEQDDPEIEDAPVGEPEEGEGASPDPEPYEDYDDPEDEDWQNWRPERPVFFDQGPGALIGELEDLLYAAEAPEPERVEALGAALLTHPDLDHVDQAVAVERWLAQAIASNFPRSDPLIEPAAARFVWRDNARLRDWEIGRIMQRREDLRFRALLERPHHPHRRAFAELSGPPRARLPLTEIGLAADVADFLALLPGRPTLEADLDPRSVAWWRDYFVGPHLPRRFGLWWGSLTALLTLFAFLAINPAEDLLVPFLGSLAGAAALSFAGIKAWSHFAAWQRRERERHWERERPPARTLALTAAAALVLPPVAALLPASWPYAALAIALTLALGWQVLRSGWINPEWAEPSNRPRVFLPAVAGIAGLLGAMQLVPAAAAMLGLPLLLAAWSGSYLFAPCRDLPAALPPPRRIAFALGGLLALLAGAAALGLTYQLELRPTLVLALVPCTLLAAHLATAFSDVDVHHYEWPLRFLLAVLYFAASFFWQGGFLAVAFSVVACYGLLYALLRTLFVLRDELTTPRRL